MAPGKPSSPWRRRGEVLLLASCSQQQPFSYSSRNSAGPGNIVMIEIGSSHLTEIFSSFGQVGVSAEKVASIVAHEAREYLVSRAAVGEHLTDQILLPLALAGEGSFTAQKINLHARTNTTETVFRVLREYRQPHSVEGSRNPTRAANQVRTSRACRSLRIAENRQFRDLPMLQPVPPDNPHKGDPPQLQPPFSLASLPASLEKAGLDWRSYGGDFVFRNISGLLGKGKNHGSQQFSVDAAKGDLPAVSWLYSETLSEHPPHGAAALRLLAQRKGEQRNPRGDGHVLATADGVGHWPGGDVPSDGNLPQQRAVASVEGEEILSAKSATGDTLTAPKVDSVNTLPSPASVVPKAVSAKIQSRRLALTLNRKSVTVISVKQ